MTAAGGLAGLDRTAVDRVRGRLLGVGYRITGTWADAEDAADEALARLVGLDPGSHPDNPEAWLTTVTTRLCLDRLRRRRREDYVGAWLPEPVDTALLPAELAEQREDLRIAVLLAYEQLAPDERAAFVLREAYALPYAEIAETLDAAVPTVRQWVSRARRRLDTDLRPPERAPEPVITRLVEAVLAGDLEQTIEVLTADVRVVSDSDGKVNAARRDIVGARKCAYFLIKAAELSGGMIAPVEVNGEFALAVVSRGVVRVAQLGVVDDRVTRVYFHSNPAKLTRLALPEGFEPTPRAGSVP
ncbi:MULTISPECIES: sigma-70 family RNA polymerase sigma factor [unclassified Dietzia]|uniref:sigma-70 family RNA polymerase sigma factor n=1 Tax=unclassified Dietzia TaxID=2617939 RepID=UPI0015FD876E|nr:MULTISPECIES: sigma-70 family RNA polymerase sigma factor [unclassified Dietzia]MBB1025276.1 sigma-70 family RNA polymerase sigma factor [Dietzia sp. DQ12-76]MBB1026944.1 sigma-70 family RNA polymerase sigma factor [Dietzia sp. DQ11-38-2]